MIEYKVIATVWDSDKEMQVEKIQGTFPSYCLARMFRESYEKFYSSKCKIIKYTTTELQM